MNATTTTTAVSGLRLLEAIGYDRKLAAIVICAQPDSEQTELLDSIPPGPSRRNVAASVAAIRQSLGLPADHAIAIAQGTE